MSSDLVKQWLQTVLKPYPSRDRILTEVIDVLSARRTLSVKTNAFTFDSGQTALLILLHGTLPITFRGATYHIPINIWIPLEYPRSPPMAFVVPTKEMGVRKGTEVEPGGRVREEVVVEWWNGWQEKTIENLIRQLISVFSQTPPVYARPVESSASNPAPGPPSPTTTNRAVDHGPISAQSYNNTNNNADRGLQNRVIGFENNQPPPPPARPAFIPPNPNPQYQDHLPQYRPAPTPPPSHHFTNQSSPPPLTQSPVQSNFHPTQSHHPGQPYYPTSLASPQNSIPGPSRQSSQPPLEGQPYLPQRPQSFVAPPAQAAQQPPPMTPPRPGLSHQMNPGYGPDAHYSGDSPGYSIQQQSLTQANAIPFPTNQYAQHPPPSHTHSQTQPPFNPGVPPSLPPSSSAQVAHINPPKPQRQVMLDLLSSPEENTIPLPDSNTNIPNPNSPPPLPPSKPPPPSLLHLHSILQPHLSASLQPILHSLQQSHTHLLERREDLLSGEPAIRDEMARLEAVKKVCDSVGRRMEEVVRAGEERVQELEAKGEVSVDEVVCGISIVHNQLIDLVAEDNAIEDTIYHLTRALDAERIDLDRFLKSIRSLAREQYMKRALIERILKGMGQTQGW